MAEEGEAFIDAAEQCPPRGSKSLNALECTEPCLFTYDKKIRKYSHMTCTMQAKRTITPLVFHSRYVSLSGPQLATRPLNRSVQGSPLTNCSSPARCSPTSNSRQGRSTLLQARSPQLIARCVRHLYRSHQVGVLGLPIVYLAFNVDSRSLRPKLVIFMLGVFAVHS